VTFPGNRDTAGCIITSLQRSHEDAATDLGVERDRVLAVGTDGGMLKIGIDRAGPMMSGRVSASLAIYLQHQLIRGGLDKAQDLIPWFRHDIRRLDEHHVISWP